MFSRQRSLLSDDPVKMLLANPSTQVGSIAQMAVGRLQLAGAIKDDLDVEVATSNDVFAMKMIGDPETFVATRTSVDEAIAVECANAGIRIAENYYGIVTGKTKDDLSRRLFNDFWVERMSKKLATIIFKAVKAEGPFITEEVDHLIKKKYGIN